jgi:hypothetical protein
LPGTRLIRFAVAGVLKGHPAVAGLGHRPHHLGVEIAGLYLRTKEAFFLGLDVFASNSSP